MIERKDVMPVNFLKKEKFTGSYRGRRYRMEKAAKGEEEKIHREFPFSEEGIRSGVDWLNEQYGEGFER